MSNIEYNLDGSVLVRVPEDYVGKLVIPEGVEKIDELALAHCSELTEVQLPSTLKIIDDCAFKRCVNLKSVVIPNSVKKVGAGAFSFCHSLENVQLSDNLTIIESDVFRETSIEGIVIPCSVTKIEEDAFRNCFYLHDVQLPVDIEIEDTAFTGCSCMHQADALCGTAICDEQLKTKYKYYGKILPSQWKSDTPSGNTKIKVYRGFYVDDIETAERIVEDIKQKGLYLEQIESIHKEGRGHEKLDRNRLDIMYADKNILVHNYECFNKEYVYFGDYVCAMNYALRGGYSTIPIVIEAEMELDELNIDGVDSFNHIFRPEINNALMRQIFGEKVEMYYEKCRAETINTDDDKSREIKRVVCDMAMSDNDIVYAFHKNSKCIWGKFGNRFKSAFQAKLPIDSSRIISVRIVSRDYRLPESDISLSDFR